MWSRIFQMGAPVIAAVSLALPLSAHSQGEVFKASKPMHIVAPSSPGAGW